MIRRNEKKALEEIKEKSIGKYHQQQFKSDNRVYTEK